MTRINLNISCIKTGVTNVSTCTGGFKQRILKYSYGYGLHEYQICREPETTMETQRYISE